MKRFLEIDYLLKFSKTITLVALCISFLSISASLSYGIYLNKLNLKEKIYVLEGSGNVLVANTVKDALMWREPEIRSHLKKFHNYFFNLDQFNYKKNIEKSLDLIDESGKKLLLNIAKPRLVQLLKIKQPCTKEYE